jgi:hypothetical protein
VIASLADPPRRFGISAHRCGERAMADKDQTYPVFIDKIDMGKTFDDKLTKDMPDVAAKALADAYGKPFEVVKTRPKEKGFNISGTIKTLDYEEDKEQLSGEMSLVLATMPGRSIFGAVSSKGKLGGIKPKKLDAMLRKLVEAMAQKCAKESADDMEKKAKDK